MPIAPYVWQLSDFLTATRLNAELYATRGMGFWPNGTGFHAAKPVYKGGQNNISASNLTASVWKSFKTTLGNVSVAGDTAGFFGNRMDPAQNVTAELDLPNTGGLVGSPGGLGLVSVVAPMQTGAGAARCGIGPQSGSSPNSTGIITSTDTANNIAPFAVDIADLGAGTAPQTGWAFSTQTTPALGNNSTDGSGRSARMGIHWASVYPGNGTTVGSAPAPKASWAGNTSLTAALLNGSAGIVSMMNLLNMPPLLRVQASGTTSCLTGTPTVISLPAATWDTYAGWSNANDAYTVPLAGLYFCAGFVPFDPIGNGSWAHTGIQVNGVNFWGPRNPTVTSVGNASGKVGIFDLQAGDVVKLVTEQNTGSTQSTSSSFNPLLVLLYLGATGTSANFLTGDAAGFEGGIANWTAAGNDAIAQTAAQAHSGTKSLALTSTAAGSMQAAHCTAGNILTQGMPCSPGDTVQGSAWFRSAVTARSCNIGADFYDSGGTLLSTLRGGNVTDSTSAWTQASAAVTAPASAAFCRANTQVVSTAAGAEVHYVDDVILYGPSTMPVVPDVTYAWQAGTPGASMAGLLNAHLANDLAFLNQRPYLLSSQGTAQTFTSGADFQVNMDTIAGVVHGAAGDPWGGWDSTNKRWVAPVSGWYFCVWEWFCNQPSVTTGAVFAKLQPILTGNAARDTYQASLIPASVGNGGAAAVGYYYLRAGDWIEPWASLSTGASAATSVTGASSHFEVCWISQ